MSAQQGGARPQPLGSPGMLPALTPLSGRSPTGSVSSSCMSSRRTSAGHFISRGLDERVGSDAYALPRAMSGLRANYLLHVKVVEARGLPAVDRNGLSDPFCKLYVDKVKQRTRTVPKELNPVWDQAFTFPVFSVDETLQVVLWDRDLFSRNSFLGKVRIDLRMLSQVATMQNQAWYSLWDKEERHKVAGQINLKLCLRETYEDRARVLKLLAKRPELVAQQQSTALNFQARIDVPRQLNLGVATWNMGGDAPEADLTGWLCRDLPPGGYDLIVVATQEFRYQPRAPFKTTQADWVSTLQTHFGPDYKLLAYEAFHHMNITVLAHKRTMPTVTSCLSAAKLLHSVDASGVHSVAVVIGHMRIAFVNVCLSRNGTAAQRNADLSNVMRALDFGSEGGRPKKKRTGEEALDFSAQFDHVFMLGDFAYSLRRWDGPAGRRRSAEPRVQAIQDDLDVDVIVRRINRGELETVFKGDELSREMARGNVLFKFREGFSQGIPTPDEKGKGGPSVELKDGHCKVGTPHFGPTSLVKRRVGMHYDSDDVPAWSDRILWKSLPGLQDSVKQWTLHTSLEQATSHHKPLFSTFTVNKFDLPSAVDGRVGACSMQLVDLSARYMLLRNETGAIVAGGGELQPYVTLSSPIMADEVSTTVRDESVPLGRHNAMYEWLDEDVPNMELRHKFNSKARLRGEFITVTVRDKKAKGAVIGSGLMHLQRLADAEVLHDDVFDRWCTHFRFNVDLTLHNRPTGVVHGICMVMWNHYAAGAGVGGGGRVADGGGHARSRSTTINDPHFKADIAAAAAAQQKQQQPSESGARLLSVPGLAPSHSKGAASVNTILRTIVTGGPEDEYNRVPTGDLPSPDPVDTPEKKAREPVEAPRADAPHHGPAHSNLSRITASAAAYHVMAASPVPANSHKTATREALRLQVVPKAEDEVQEEKVLEILEADDDDWEPPTRHRQLSEDGLPPPPPPSYPHPDDIGRALDVTGERSEQRLVAEVLQLFEVLAERRVRAGQLKAGDLSMNPAATNHFRSSAWDAAVARHMREQARELQPWKLDALNDMLQSMQRQVEAALLRTPYSPATVSPSVSAERVIIDSDGQIAPNLLRPATEPMEPPSSAAMAAAAAAFEARIRSPSDQPGAIAVSAVAAAAAERVRTTPHMSMSRRIHLPPHEDAHVNVEDEEPGMESDYEEDSSDDEKSSIPPPPPPEVPFPFDSVAEYEIFKARKARTFHESSSSGIWEHLAVTRAEHGRALSVASGQRHVSRPDVVLAPLPDVDVPPPPPDDDYDGDNLQPGAGRHRAVTAAPGMGVTSTQIPAPLQRALSPLLYCSDCDRVFYDDGEFARHVLLHR